MLEKLMNIDRKIIFILVALTVIIPTLIPVRLPTAVSEPTQKLYDYIDALPPESTIIIAFDYGPSSLAEPEPMAKAVLQHCFNKDVRVIGMTLYPNTPTLAHRLMRKIAAENGATYGENYVFLGYRPGLLQVILGMGTDIASVFETDYDGTAITEIPMMKDIRNYEQIDLLLDLAAGSTTEAWIVYANTRYNLKIAAGVTGVIIAQMYPFLQTGQLVGLMPGYLGATEYEKLLDAPGDGTIGLNTASFVHLLIIGLVFLGNIAFFIQRQREE